MALRTGQRAAILTAAVLGVAMASQVSASTYTWVFAATPSAWNSNVPTGWTSSDGGLTFPQSVGDTANLNFNITASQTVNLNVPITLTTLNIGDITTASNGFTVAPNGGSLTFQASSGNAALTEVATSNGDTISAPITLNSSVDFNLLAAKTLTLSGAVGGTGGINLLNTSNAIGTVSLQAANSFSGNIVINGGILQMNGDSRLGTTATPQTITVNTTGASPAIFNPSSPVALASNRTLSIGSGGATISNGTGAFTLGFANQLTGTGAVTVINNSNAAGSMVLNATNSTFTGNLNLTTGAVTYNALNALGGHAITANTANGGGQVTLGAAVSSAALTDTVTIGTGGVISGAQTQLALLTSHTPGSITLTGNPVIAETVAGDLVAANIPASMGNGNDLFFGIKGTIAEAAGITVGASGGTTPWRGVSTDANSATLNSTTLTVASDFYLQAFNGRTLTLTNSTIAPSTPRTVFLVGGGILSVGAGNTLSNLSMDIGRNAITSSANYTLRNLTLTSDGTVTTTGGNTVTGTGILTFDSGTAGVASNLNVPNTLAPTTSIFAPVSLASDLNINLAASTTLGNKAGVAFNNNLTLNGKTITVSGGYKGASDGTQISLGTTVDGLIGNGTIINNSDSPFDFNKTSLLFTGTLVATGQAAGTDANSGTFTLTYGSVKNAAEIIINGFHDGTNQLGGKVQIGTGSTIAAMPANQRLTQNKITMNGGLLSDAACPLSPANTGAMQADTVANFNFNSGFSFVNISGSTTTAGNTLTATTVGRSQGATAFFRAAAPTTIVTQMKAGNGASLFVGSTATTGTATGIIPWMVASTNASNLAISNFATYDAAQGFRVLAASEYSTTLATGANVATGALTSLAQDWTLNSLFMNGSGVQTPNPTGPIIARTISITSGGLAFSLNGGGIGEAGNNLGRAGTIAFASAEGVITNAALATNTIGSVITGTGGLTKGGMGRLVLTGANVITGDTHVGGGQLQVGDNTYNGKISSGNVFVDSGALLDIRDNAAVVGTSIDYISDTGTVALAFNGVLKGQVSINNGIDTVGALTLGGVSQAAGYYGSTTAAAANPSLTVVTDNTYFSGNGLLQVGLIPEPATLSLMAIGGLVLLRRRRAR